MGSGALRPRVARRAELLGVMPWGCPSRHPLPNLPSERTNARDLGQHIQIHLPALSQRALGCPSLQYITPTPCKIAKREGNPHFSPL